MPYSGGPPSSLDAGPFRRTMRWTWLAGLAITLLGVGVVGHGIWTGLSVGGREGTPTVAEIERVGGSGVKPVVSFTTRDGERVEVELEDAASDYQSGGPISIVYDEADPSTAYDANAREGLGSWLPEVLSGLALVAFGSWAMRAARRHRKLLARASTDRLELDSPNG